MKDNIDQVLDEMIALIKQQENNSGWADLLIHIKSELSEDPKMARHSIMSIYGGMGSLNDVVLYESGQPLAQENVELDRLRSKLYKLALSL